LLAALLCFGEPITPALMVGLMAVFAGIWLASTNPASGA